MSQYHDEGYIKFNCLWLKGDAPKHPLMVELIHWRNMLHKKGWIGFDARHQVGYGNLSISDQKGFIVSGTQTGHIVDAENKHFVTVLKYNLAKNMVECTGHIQASSETLTHAVIYEKSKETHAVIHIHDELFWKRLLNNVPTTAQNIPYGTPEMAYEIQRHFDETNLNQSKIIAMAGHEGGIIAFGKDLKEAFGVLEKYINVLK